MTYYVNFSAYYAAVIFLAYYATFWAYYAYSEAFCSLMSYTCLCTPALQEHLLAIQTCGFSVDPPVFPNRGHPVSQAHSLPRAGSDRFSAWPADVGDHLAPPSLHQNDLQARTPGIFLGEATETKVPHSAHTMHGWLPVVGHQLSAADRVFPHKVKHALEAGMLEYISLDLLTNEACCCAA